LLLFQASQVLQLTQAKTADELYQNAANDWDVFGNPDICPPGDFYSVDNDVIDFYSHDQWTYDYATLFKPLCANQLAPPRPYSEEASKEGFTGRKDEDFVTWFFKWYWRLDETWSIENTRDEPYTTDITWSWLREHTDG
jgi:hypothetical protein